MIRATAPISWALSWREGQRRISDDAIGDAYGPDLKLTQPATPTGPPPRLAAATPLEQRALMLFRQHQVLTASQRAKLERIRDSQSAGKFTQYK